MYKKSNYILEENCRYFLVDYFLIYIKLCKMDHKSNEALEEFCRNFIIMR